MEKVRINVLNKKATPRVAHDGDAGIDLAFNIATAAGYTVLQPNEVIEFGVGIKCAIPKGWVGLVLPRSGTGYKYEVRLANTVGVIDSNYRGEIRVKLRNCGDKDWEIGDFDYICQMVIVPHYKVYDNMEFVDDLDKTNRGEDGFGSSDK